MCSKIVNKHQPEECLGELNNLKNKKIRNLMPPITSEIDLILSVFAFFLVTRVCILKLNP